MGPGKSTRAVSVDKEEQYKRVFRHLDIDGDGKITAEELRRSTEMTKEEAEEAVRAVDRDGDGKLGMEEFVAMMEAEDEEGEEESVLREAFKRYEDEEEEGLGSGKCITAKSLKRMLSRLGDKRSVGECKTMISMFDVDGDGVLSFHEFKLMMS